MADECLAIEEEGASFEEIINTVAGSKGQVAYHTGDSDSSLISCSQIAGLITEIKTVQKVFDSIISEAEELLRRLNALLVG